MSSPVYLMGDNGYVSGTGSAIVELDLESDFQVAFVFTTYNALQPPDGEGWYSIANISPGSGGSNTFRVLIREGKPTQAFSYFYLNAAGPPTRSGMVSVLSFGGELLRHKFAWASAGSYVSPGIPRDVETPEGFSYLLIRTLFSSAGNPAPYSPDWNPSHINYPNSRAHAVNGGYVQPYGQLFDSDYVLDFPEAAFPGYSLPYEHLEASTLALSLKPSGVEIETPQGVGKLTTVLSGQEVQPTGLEIIQP